MAYMENITKEKVQLNLQEEAQYLVRQLGLTEQDAISFMLHQRLPVNKMFRTISPDEMDKLSKSDFEATKGRVSMLNSGRKVKAGHICSFDWARKNLDK